jgi:hypothetical protein
MRCVPSIGPPNGKRKFRREDPETFTNFLTRFAPLHKSFEKSGVELTLLHSIIWVQFLKLTDIFQFDWECHVAPV